MGKAGLIRLAALAVVLMLPLGLAGCGDPRDVTLAEPGQYKGKTDPLLALEATPAHQEALRERFRYQKDR